MNENKMAHTITVKHSNAIKKDRADIFHYSILLETLKNITASQMKFTKHVLKIPN